MILKVFFLLYLILLIISQVKNQENITNVKSKLAAVPVRTKRAALGEISNKVNTLRGVEPIDRTSLLQKDKKKIIPKRENVEKKPLEKIIEKSPLQIVKPVNKIIIPVEPKTPTPTVNSKQKTRSFSSDLLEFEDVDEQDNDNPILVSVYTYDIHEYLRMLEKECPIKKEYLKDQEVTPKMRSVLIDWLVEVHQQFRLMQETLYLTVAVIDRFLQV